MNICSVLQVQKQSQQPSQIQAKAPPTPTIIRRVQNPNGTISIIRTTMAQTGTPGALTMVPTVVNNQSPQQKQVIQPGTKKVLLSKDGKMIGAQLVHKPTQSNANSANNTGKRAILRVRPRRVRCKTCEACLGGDCKQCVYCKDMTKYGGPGRMKQTCEKRRCLHPQLPVCAHCSICNLDGWFNTPKLQGKEAERPEEPPNLYECIVCLDIVHPRCIEKTVGLGQINHDLSNSWECAKCSNSGQTQRKFQIVRNNNPSNKSNSSIP